MKKLITFLFVTLCFSAFSQKDKDKDIVYYEDSETKNSRFGINLLLYPNFTDRRLLDEEIPMGGGIELADDKSKGNFGLNYGVDLFYSLGSSLDIGVGVGRASAKYSVENAQFSLERDDTVSANLETETSWWNIPIKLNFNTSITDLWDLEVVPTVQLNFIDSYKTRVSPTNGDAFEKDFSAQTQNLTWSAGISLGGTYYFSENFGLLMRGHVQYMLTPLIEESNFPRESLYSFGIHTGLRINF